MEHTWHHNAYRYKTRDLGPALLSIGFMNVRVVEFPEYMNECDSRSTSSLENQAGDPLPMRGYSQLLNAQYHCFKLDQGLSRGVRVTGNQHDENGIEHPDTNPRVEDMRFRSIDGRVVRP